MICETATENAPSIGGRLAVVPSTNPVRPAAAWGF